MQLLVAEDERSAGAYLVKGLQEAGFVVDWVQSGEAALHHAREAAYDLIILDIGLPGLTGLDVVAELRPAVSTPVIFLTARDRVEDRVLGLEQGADDYLVKPYAFSELLARVRALLRRGKTLDSDLLVAGDLEMHLLRRRVVRAGQVLTLTAREYQLLELLLRRQGEILPRTLIAELVWGINFDTDTNVIEVAVRRLRAKVDDPFAAKLIHTVRGFGYVLESRP
ncbi:MAG: heavy metal response regulator transcription factor [Burkholderiaceae bacterium]